MLCKAKWITEDWCSRCFRDMVIHMISATTNTRNMVLQQGLKKWLKWLVAKSIEGCLMSHFKSSFLQSLFYFLNVLFYGHFGLHPHAWVSAKYYIIKNLYLSTEMKWSQRKTRHHTLTDFSSCSKHKKQKETHDKWKKKSFLKLWFWIKKTDCAHYAQYNFLWNSVFLALTFDD